MSYVFINFFFSIEIKYFASAITMCDSSFAEVGINYLHNTHIAGKVFLCLAREK